MAKVKFELLMQLKSGHVFKWTYYSKNEELFHQEYRIPIEHVNKLRMIVDDCFQGDCLETFEFDRL